MDTRNVTILVVDDDQFVRELLAEILQSHGYRVETAENGLDALEKYASALAMTLILSDMDMPVMSGLELIQNLRHAQDTVPIIILTGNDEVAVAIDAISSGADEYLLKDENISDTVLLSVERVLEKRQLREQNQQLMEDLTEKNKELESFNDLLKTTIDQLTHIGNALSSERNLNTLLEMLVSEARHATTADGGTLYILENNQLQFEIVQNESKNIFLGGTSGQSINFPPIPLKASNVSSYCALQKEVMHIADLDTCDDFDFSGPKEFDASRDYTTKSMLVLPMLDRQHNVVGVLQLINARESRTGNITAFTPNQVEIAGSIASQAGIAIENTRSYEKIERKNIAFERFVPQEFLRYLGKVEVEEIRLGDASMAELSVLFSDIRDFTNLSETMTLEENFLFLNGFLDHIGPAILGHSGFIDKYIGDAIMALFSGERAGGTDDAVSAALEIVERLRDYNMARYQEGYKPIDVGIGIHTGLLRLGTIGFEKRIETTVIGDTVNLASRVEGLTKKYRIAVAITAKTLQGLVDPSRFLIRELDTVQVKGKEHAITVYEVFNADSEHIKEKKHQSLQRYNEGLYLYTQRQWDDALQIFNGLHSDLPNDAVVQMYRQRCRFFQEHPPEAAWDGITRLEEK